jgi:hypothetical protein
VYPSLSPEEVIYLGWKNPGLDLQGIGSHPSSPRLELRKWVIGFFFRRGLDLFRCGTIRRVFGVNRLLRRMVVVREVIGFFP